MPMIWITMWRWGTSHANDIYESNRNFESKIIMTIKKHTIRACRIEYQQTSGCKPISTYSEKERQMTSCLIVTYLVAVRKNLRAAMKTP